MKKRLFLGSMLAAVLAATSIAASIGLDGGDSSSGRVLHVESLAVTDLRDDRKLVGLAEDVFVAKVVGERGHTVGDPVPETQYDVNVVRSIKGDLSGEVVVSQQGGVNEDGDTVLVDEDRPVRVGQTYLFATLTNEATGWHTVIPRHGDLAVDGPQKQTGLVQRFAAAHAQEIRFRATD